MKWELTKFLKLNWSAKCFVIREKKNHEKLKKDGNMNRLWPQMVTGSLEVTDHCDLLYDPKGHGDLCYVAVCNNYAICNKLQTALNCSAVCNTSYFKLRCDGNAICNVLQIASKFYHLKILKKRKKKWSTAKCIASIISYYEFSPTPIYSSSACKSPNQHYNCSERYFAPALLRSGGGGIKTHLSARLLVCLPIPLSVAKL